MMIDIQIPKPGTHGLYTLARALTDEEIAQRNPAYYAPDALRYDDCLLEDDWDSNPRIAILSPMHDYETIEVADAIEKYRKILSDDKASKDDRNNASCILGLIEANYLIDDRKTREDVKRLIAETESVFLQ